MRTQQSKIVGHWESNPKREILRITGYKKKKKKNPHNKAQINNLHSKELEKENEMKPKLRRMKEIIKFGAERKTIDSRK